MEADFPLRVCVCVRTQVLGDYYAHDSRNVFQALWEDYRKCDHVSPDKPTEFVYWYRS